MKYSITFANDTERQFYGKTTNQIEKLVTPRQGIDASVREATFGGSTFYLMIQPTAEIEVAVSKNLYKASTSDVEVIAVVKGCQAILMPMSPKDLKIVTALLSAYINVM